MQMAATMKLVGLSSSEVVCDVVELSEVVRDVVELSEVVVAVAVKVLVGVEAVV